MYSRWAAEAVLQNCARRSSLEAERRVGSTQREAPEQRHNARKGGMIRITAPERMTTCCQPAKLMAAVAAAPRRGDGRRAPADRRREWAGRAPAAECRYFSAPPALHGRPGARCAVHGGGCRVGRAAQCRIAPSVAHTAHERRISRPPPSRSSLAISKSSLSLPCSSASFFSWSAPLTLDVPQPITPTRKRTSNMGATTRSRTFPPSPSPPSPSSRPSHRRPSVGLMALAIRYEPA